MSNVIFIRLKIVLYIAMRIIFKLLK